MKTTNNHIRKFKKGEKVIFIGSNNINPNNPTPQINKIYTIKNYNFLGEYYLTLEELSPDYMFFHESMFLSMNDKTKEIASLFREVLEKKAQTLKTHTLKMQILSQKLNFKN